jgi:hypothetical protein
MADTRVAGMTAAAGTGDAVARVVALLAGVGFAVACFAAAVAARVGAGLAAIDRLGGTGRATAGFAGVAAADGVIPGGVPAAPTGGERADA